MDISKYNKIYFIGIGGVSMSSLALYYKSIGHTVAGSDVANSKIIEDLVSQNIAVNLAQDGSTIDGSDLIVYSGAIHEDNADYRRAKELNILVIERSELLGDYISHFSDAIVVSGTHGKTTTSSMLTNIFMCAKLNPSAHIGGVCNNIGSSHLFGGGQYLVVEGCEYRNSFFNFVGRYHVVLNIECDHMDYYRDFSAIKRAFLDFANHSTEYVFVPYNCEILPYISTNKKVITVGGKDGNFVANNIKFKDGEYSFDAYCNGLYLCNFKLPTIGKHNVQNALFAIAVAYTAKVPLTAIYKGLKTFAGVGRRYEEVGKISNIPLICDYAHHPTEICASISGIKEKYRNVYCVFQPHTYSRTKALINEFSTCFAGVKALAIYKTYPAREKYDKKGDASTLCRKIKISDMRKRLILDEKELEECILLWSKQKQSKNTCILVLGAGDIYNSANKFIKNR